MVLIGSEGVMQPEDGRVVIRKHSSGGVRYVQVTDNTPKQATAKAIGSAQDPETYKQYLAFEESLRSGRPPAITGEDGKTAIKLMLLAEKSLRTHRIMHWTDLPV